MADVASFVEVDMGSVETGFGGECVFIEFGAPLRDTGEDSTKGDGLWVQAFRMVEPLGNGGGRDPEIGAV